MSETPRWLTRAWLNYGQEVEDEGLGWRKIMVRYGLTKYKADALAKYVRKNGAPSGESCSCSEGCSQCSVEEVEVEVEEEVAQDSGKVDWLFEEKYVYNADTDTYITFLTSAPKPLVVPGPKHRAMKSAYSNWDGHPSSINSICERFGIPRNWFIEYKSKHGWTHDSDPFTNEEIIAKSVDQLVDDALLMKRATLHQEYEKARWRETKDKAEKWDKFNEIVLLPLTERIAKMVPEYEIPQIIVPSKNELRYALVVSPTDFHHGSYSWDKETGALNNREKARQRLFAATEKTVSRLPCKPEKIIFTIGSDFFHIDGDRPATTRGTPMEGVDGSPTEIFMTGCELVVSYIDTLRQIAPVEIIMSSGNHDRVNSLSLLMVIFAWYRNEDDVLVHKSPKVRQYTTYGDTLIGIHHGDLNKANTLGPIMSIEAREEWGRTRNRVWFTGHLHHTHMYDVNAVTICMLPSLSLPDQWHHRNGFVLTEPTMLSYMIDYKDGIIGSIRATVDKNA